MVLNNPFDRKKDPVNHDIFERFFGHIDIVKKRKEYVESVTNEIKSDIKKYIVDLDAGLLTNFNELYQEITFEFKHLKELSNQIEKKSKKLFESSSLTEDVYKIRDEMKSIKKKLDKLNRGIKGFSKLKDVFDDDDKD